MFDDVRVDLRILKVKDWRSTALDRDVWRLLVQEVKAHNGLQRQLVCVGVFYSALVTQSSNVKP
jgi:hypothetical protein